MEHNPLEKLPIPFQQKEQNEIWWKLAVVLEKLCNNIILYMYSEVEHRCKGR